MLIEITKHRIININGRPAKLFDQRETFESNWLYYWFLKLIHGKDVQVGKEWRHEYWAWRGEENNDNK